SLSKTRRLKPQSQQQKRLKTTSVITKNLSKSQGKRSGNSSKPPEKIKKKKQTTKTSAKSPVRFNKSENECRRVLQNIFIGYKFPNVRPDFMENNKTKRCLELDCYNEK